MVKHIQTIRRQQLTNCLSVFDHFVGLVLKASKNIPRLTRALLYKKFDILTKYPSILAQALQNQGNIFTI